MILTNKQIYQYASDAIENLLKLDIYIPAKANFFLQKNLQIITDAAKEIEQSRVEILEHYGERVEDQYTILPEHLDEAAKEIEDLFSIEQNLDIKTFTIESLGAAEFKPAQMKAMMFMIED